MTTPPIKWSRFRACAELLRQWGKPFRFAGICGGGWVTFPVAIRNRAAANDPLPRNAES